MGKRGHDRAHSQVKNPQGGILRDFSPSGRAPIPPTVHHGSEIQLRKRTGGLYFNNWEAHHAPDRALTTTEQRGCPTQYLPRPPGGRHQSRRSYNPHACRKGTANTKLGGKKMKQQIINLLKMKEQCNKRTTK